MAKSWTIGLTRVVALAVVVLLASCEADDAVTPDESQAPPAAEAASDQGAPAETAKQVEATAEMANWMGCAKRVYDEESAGTDKFDEQAHARSWEACAAERQKVFDLFPASERQAWEERLRGIHDSIRTSAIAEHTARPGYGLNPYQPVMVGGLSQERNEGVARILRYLVRLRGPEGQPITYERIGSCCSFKTPNPVYGNRGRLDMYEVTFEGLEDPVVVYFNVYDEAPLQVVAGLTMIQG